MTVREYKESDREAVEEIFALYWTDPEFLEELSGELELYTKGKSGKDSGFFVAEKDGKILGIAGFKKPSGYLKPFAQTDNPIELYVIASKYKRKGIGKKLKEKIIEKAQKSGFSEILLFSPNSHSDSWGFHDDLGFERVGEVTPPDDETGHVWRKTL